MEEVKFKIGVISHFPDETSDFEKLNVDFIYDYRMHLGRNFAQELVEKAD